MLTSLRLPTCTLRVPIFFSVSEVGAAFMGDTAEHSRFEPNDLRSISNRISHQNTQFNMYTKTSKQQEGSRCKNSHLKCFITTNFDKFHRERAVNRSVVFPLKCLNIHRTIYILLSYLYKTHVLTCKQDAYTGVHSACRREENWHNLDIWVLLIFWS